MVVPVACHFEGDIEDLSVQLSVTQRFVNAGSEPLEAAYSWPLHHTFSCIGLKATIMSEDHPPRVIVGRIMQKAGAKQVISCCNQWGFMLYLLQAYDQAVGDNHSACLLQQSAARSDCALVNVGSVGPGTEALISALWMMVSLSLHLFKHSFTPLRFIWIWLPLDLSPSLSHALTCCLVSSSCVGPGTSVQLQMTLIGPVRMEGRQAR